MKTEIEIEKKIRISNQTSQKIKDYILKTYSQNLKCIQIKQKDYYFDTVKEDYKNSNSILRVRHDIKNKTYLLTYKFKKNSEITSIERQKEINKDEFEKLQKIGLLEFDDKKKFFIFGKVLLKAEIKTQRDRYIYNDFNIDFDKTTFFENYTDYELEIEGSKEKLVSQFIEKIKFELKIKDSSQTLPKIARYFQIQNKLLQTIPVNKIFVVEGIHDSNRLQKIFPNIITFITSGLGLTEGMIEELKMLVAKNNLEVVVFTDPDTPGEIIRKIINDNFKNVQNAYIDKNNAIASKKKKVGIEHASKYEIIKSLANLKISHKSKKKIKYTMKDLIKYKIYANTNLRRGFCHKLGISYGNNKKVLNQLNNYQIPSVKIEEVLEELTN